MTDNKTSVKDMFLRGIAVLGLIAVLLLGAWGIIQIAVALPSFFAGLGDGVSTVFERPGDSRPATTTTATTARPSTTVTSTTTTKPSTSAAPARNLFGSPDLSVRILSASTYRGHTSVSFEIANWGTNVAPQGWSFVAELPLDSDEYPYHSGSQQALYPGDRIVYTLGFNAEDSYGDDCEWDNRRDRFECDEDDDRRNNDDEVTIIVDPYGHVYESNERNNEVDFEI